MDGVVRAGLPVVIVLPYWSSIVTPTDTVPPAVMEAGWVVIDQLVLGGGRHGERVGGRRGHGSVGGVRGGDGVAAGRRDGEAVEGGHAARGRHRGRAGGEAARRQRHVDGVGRAGVPVVIVLPYWSSTVAPTVIVAPAATGEAGWVVMTSLFSPAGLTVKRVGGGRGHRAVGGVRCRDGVAAGGVDLEPAEGGHPVRGRDRRRAGGEAARGQRHVDGVVGARVARRDRRCRTGPRWSRRPTPCRRPSMEAGWAVMTSLFSAAGVTVNELVVAAVTVPWVVSEAVMV